MAFILVVEANPTLAGRASDVLIAAGHACAWVTGTAQAMTLLRWRTPDLVLLDQSLPGAGDGTLPQGLRRAANAPDLPMILLTREARAEPHDSSIVDHIQKPFDPRYLVWRVNHALETHVGGASTLDEAEPAAQFGEDSGRLRSIA